mmetsp:Transcript_12275/g.29312  ORF Transcript_12275/g.29312 Transcript_12275/m.29312 type:complete len:211 (+) Transcript_12275:1106-1738(+)
MDSGRRCRGREDVGLQRQLLRLHLQQLQARARAVPAAVHGEQQGHPDGRLARQRPQRTALYHPVRGLLRGRDRSRQRWHVCKPLRAGVSAGWSQQHVQLCCELRDRGRVLRRLHVGMLPCPRHPLRHQDLQRCLQDGASHCQRRLPCPGGRVLRLRGRRGLGPQLLHRGCRCLGAPCAVRRESPHSGWRLRQPVHVRADGADEGRAGLRR